MSALQTTLAGTPAVLLRNATDPPKAKPTRRQGVVYVAPGGKIFEEIKLNAENISTLSENNYYLRNVLNKLIYLLFSGDYQLDVYDPAKQPAPAVAEAMRMMCDTPEVNLWGNCMQSFIDSFWWGSFIGNPVWDYVGNVYTLKELNRLAPEAFIYPASQTGDIYSPILQGITLNEKTQQIEYWYTDKDGNQEQLISPFIVRAPMSSRVTGTPMIQPLIGAVSYLDAMWKAVGQSVNRVGAPNLLLKVTGGDPEDWEYANAVVENWGKNTAFPLKENIEPVNSFITESATPMEAINTLSKMIIDFFSPTSMIESGDKSIFSNSSNSNALLMAFVRGIHSWIEDNFERLLQLYLINNRYDGYTVRLTLPDPDIDKTDQNMVVLRTLSDTGIANTNELRQYAPGLEPLDDEGLAALAEANRAKQPAATPSFFGNAAMQDRREEDAAIAQIQAASEKAKRLIIAELEKM